MPVYQLDHWKIQRWQKGTRYYICQVKQDLFGTWLACSEWGGLYAGRRRLREEPFDSYAAALARFEQINRHRQKRGYLPVSE